MGLILGALSFEGLQAPVGLRFGGAQDLAVHRLPGGGRVVDVIGADDADISWRGCLCGATAEAQAQLLDAMRQQGAPQTLSWGEQFHTVLIASVDFHYRSVWWIDYAIRCTIVEALQVGTLLVSAIGMISGDLQAAAGAGTFGLVAMLSNPDAMTAGTSANAALSAAMSGAVVQNAAAVTAAGNALGTAQTVPDMVSATGALAASVSASGYLARARQNFMEASG